MSELRRILLIEADLEEARLLRARLGDAAAFTGDISHASTLQQAAELLGAGAAHDVILLNLALPDSQGLDSYRALRAIDSELPVVILSGIEDEELAARAVELGAQDYLVRHLTDGPGLLRALRYAVARRASEAAVLASEERFRALVEHSWDAYTLIDADGRIIYISPAVRRTAGLSPEQVQGLNVTDFVHPDWRARFQDAFAESLRRPGEPVRIAARVLREGGGWRYLEGILTNLLHVPSVRAIVNNTRDVTEHYEAELLFRSAIDVSPAGMLMMDADQRIVLANRQITELFGWPESELVGQPLEKLLPERLRGNHDRFVRQFLDQPSRRPMGAGNPLLGLRADGTEFPIEVGLAPVEMDQRHLVLASVIDISERLEAQARLRDVVVRLQALMDNARDGIAVLSDEGVVLEVNPRMCELLGQPAEAVTGHHFRDFVSARSLEREAEFEIAREAGQGTHVGIEVQRPDGSIVLIDFSNSRVRLGDETLVLSIGRDMSQQRALEAQLRQAQKMDALGRLAGGVAHDFNNLLTVMYGYIDQLRGGGSHSRNDALEQLRATTDRAAALVRQLLAFGRKQVLRPTEVEVNQVVRGLEEMLGRLLGATVLLDVRVDPDAGSALIDSSQLEQVLVNLAVNARDAMPEGGTLAISTRSCESRLRPEEEPRPCIRIEVSDTGHGMPAEIQARAFEPFFTTKPPGKGTGLGLSMVFGIIEQMGGSISVHSQPGHGTTFTILLPRHMSGASEGSAAPAPSTAPAGRPDGVDALTVLLAEDEAQIRELICMQLAGTGWRVIPAGAMDAALAAAADEPQIDLLITDVMMPGGMGTGLATRLREARPGLPVLFISGYTAGDEHLEAFGMEGSAFLQKPFTSARLLAEIRRLLADAGHVCCERPPEDPGRGVQE